MRELNDLARVYGEYYVLTLFQPKQNPQVGIDITSIDLKCIVISKNRHSYFIEHYAQIALPSGAIQSGIIKDFDAVSMSMKILLREAGFANSASIAIPDALIFRKTQPLPKDISSSLHDWVLLQTEQWTEEIVYCDFAFEKDTRDVTIIASKAEFVDSRVEVLQQLGLSVASVDVESLAKQRALLFLEAEQHASVATDFHFVSPEQSDFLVALGLALKGFKLKHA